MTLRVECCLLLQELRECFEKQDIPLLQETIHKMDEKECLYHMKRAIDSGLWVPEKKLPWMEKDAEELRTEIYSEIKEPSQSS